MNFRRFSSCFLLIFLLLPWLGACQPADEYQGPSFTWAAFQRFWSRGMDERLALVDVQKNNQGYMVDYGRGVRLYVLMINNEVRALEADYLATPNNYEGGAQFLRLMQHMMRVGSFGWTLEERETLLHYYTLMTRAPRTFRYKEVLFFREGEPAPHWRFSLQFMQDIDVLSADPPLPAAVVAPIVSP